VRELQPGLWHWESQHPDWEGELAGGRPNEPWDTIVSSYALIDDADGLLLFDPLAVPDEIQEVAAGRETAIVLTAPWHERDTRALVERHQWPLFSPPRETEDDLMERWGVTREQAAGGSPDLKWVGDSVDYHPVSAGERLLPDVESFPARGRHEAVYWVESRRALVVGDALADFGSGLEANGWPEGAGSREALVEVLRPLLSLPVELVLPAHGAPGDRAALERALS
jgi:glyoxylase-like metal-dependent hydrolase (beta-lactamase superfamily II)